MSKRGFNLTSAIATKQKTDASAVSAGGGASGSSSHSQRQTNPFLSQPVNPEEAIYIFLVQSRTTSRRMARSKGVALPLTEPIVEIEARLGVLKSPYGLHDMRVASGGAKSLPDRANPGKSRVYHAFLCNSGDGGGGAGTTTAPFESGVTRSHFVRWTAAGLSEPSPLSQAFGVRTGGAASGGGASSSSGEAAQLKKELHEVESVETVYGGYPGSRRVCFKGEHPNPSGGPSQPGHMERKGKMENFDVALPSASYDLRLTMATEQTEDPRVAEPPQGWSTKRLKRRRSYTRKDKSFGWQLDVTEVTVEATAGASAASSTEEKAPIVYEIEMELSARDTLKLVNLPDEDAAKRHARNLSKQLWWMLGQINPLSEVLEVESYVQDHPSKDAARLAFAQLHGLKRYLDSGGDQWSPAIPAAGRDPPKVPQNLHFIGCMPVNFSRHNIEDVQRDERGYFLSEKTDGVRYLMVFTGSTAILVDRSMKGGDPKGYQPVTPSSAGGNNGKDPMSHVLPLIQPGTVLDGEVVIHRKLRRPVFIVFDILCSGSTPVLHLPFEERLNHLKKASFRTREADRDMFATSAVKDLSVPLPLVRKNFVRRTKLDELLSFVAEERGVRLYRNGECHNHLTDGIIFQPNRPYTAGTDVHLLKWKYLDTVTIDVEILPPGSGRGGGGNSGDEDVLRVGVLGEDGTVVDMTRFVKLPPSERLRLEADRNESGAKIAEVGFDPETGEWYYLTMRPDKLVANHISTVLGTLLELAESLGTNELRYRMSVRGGRDTYRKDVRSMQKQLLDHQRKKNAGR